jgi:hypothetical protein
MQKDIVKIMTPLVTALIGTISTMALGLIKSGGSDMALAMVLVGIATIGLFGFAIYQISKQSGGIGKNVNLNHHPIFQRIADNQDYVQRGFSMNNKVKKVLFQDILFNVLVIYDKKVRDFVRGLLKSQPSDAHELYGKFHGLVNDIVIRIGDYYNTNQSSYTDEDKQAIMVASRYFLKWHTKDLKVFLRQCERIIMDDNLYPHMTLKASIVLTMLESFLTTIFIDVKDTVEEMNGQLSKLKFRNLVIGE